MNSFSVFSIHTLPSSSSHPSPYFTAPFGTATCSIHSLFIFLLSYLHMILIKGRNDATRFNFLFQNINSIKIWFCLYHIIIYFLFFSNMAAKAFWRSRNSPRHYSRVIFALACPVKIVQHYELCILQLSSCRISCVNLIMMPLN